ncbi:hypothetical protein JT06_07915 [Desulfobulbus sp. Tol-SR]|nr:hypothetical protein JT06_07915 [Desulfobulbus sp. Tol-SR]
MMLSNVECGGQKNKVMATCKITGILKGDNGGDAGCRDFGLQLEISSLRLDLGLQRSLPAVEMTAGVGGQAAMTVLVVPGRVKDVMPPPLSFRSEARNLLMPRMLFLGWMIAA